MPVKAYLQSAAEYEIIHTKFERRKLIYTGVTRAKSNLFLLGEEEAIKKAINNNILNDRKTTLLDMVNKMYEKIDPDV